MTKAELIAIHPVLPSRDVSKSIDYYVKRLGFQLAFQDHPEKPMYAGVSRDRIEIHLQWHDPDEWDAVDRPQLRIYVRNLADLFETYRQRDVFLSATDLRKTAWGTEEFAFFDLDRNGLVFYRDLEP